MKTAFTITGRMKSTRLPLKLMRYVEKIPIFEHMIDRVKLAKRPDKIILCTSTNPQDDVLLDVCEKKGIEYFRGSEMDVLERLYQTAVEHNLDFIGNITADSPFVDSDHIDKTFDEFDKTGADLVRCFDLPHGAYSYGIKVAAMEKIMEIKDETDTEVWGEYFTNTKLFTVHDMEVIKPVFKRPELRMTLDYPEDLVFFREVFKRLYKEGEVFTLEQIIKLLDDNPEIVEINAHCEEKYLKNIENKLK